MQFIKFTLLASVICAVAGLSFTSGNQDCTTKLEQIRQILAPQNIKPAFTASNPIKYRPHSLTQNVCAGKREWFLAENEFKSDAYFRRKRPDSSPHPTYVRFFQRDIVRNLSPTIVDLNLKAKLVLRKRIRFTDTRAQRVISGSEEPGFRGLLTTYVQMPKNVGDRTPGRDGYVQDGSPVLGRQNLVSGDPNHRHLCASDTACSPMKNGKCLCRALSWRIFDTISSDLPLRVQRHVEYSTTALLSEQKV
ncbi:hypothetical protein B0H17DRAFT_1151497 [Mycena rosella]|uniref:Uncharacterized protein n=1 Tax=Mycena rosella TaxID=1033263 RepID=A0AAD7FJ31_MYCRO|nr:hypothetical protein B0H17DRAFT_1151497 [Mycena rosella]